MARRPARGVDIVVPLAGAHGDVAALVASLRGTAVPYRWLFVDETTTELRQGALRKRLAASAGVECLWLRASGRGVMAALAAAWPESVGDIALLDPRVRVPADWLDRLTAWLASDRRIGIVGTWSTADRDAPGFVQRLALGGAWHAPDTVDDAIALAAVPVCPDVGIVAGPCVLVRRAVVDAAHRGGRLRSMAALSAAAHDLGMRAVLADDCVVQHVPYSFDPGTPADDDAGVGRALASVGMHDPVAPLRIVLGTTLAMLERSTEPGVLHVAHARGGGTERYLRDAIEATRHTHRHYVLRIHADRWTLEDTRDDAFATYDWPRHVGDDAFLRDICAWLRVDLVHVHSVVGSGDDFLAALRVADVPYVYTAHDMYVPCPSVYLIGSDGRYCNATTAPATCNACLAGMPGLADIDIVRWRARYAPFMNEAKQVIAPSQWAADTVRAYYPAANVVVAPHGAGAPAVATEDALDVVPLPDDAKRHIGILGAVGPEKGSRRLDDMAQRIRERGLPLRLVVIGFTDRECRFEADDHVLTVHGPYARGDVERLCDAYRIVATVFPSIWPETFSYTLGESWSAGRPALVPARGALGERVAATQAGWTMDPDAGIDAWLDRLVQVSDLAGGELDAASARARQAAAALAATDDPAVALYAQWAQRDPASELRAHDAHAVYAAACRAAGVAALPRVASAPQVPAVDPTTRPSFWQRLLRRTA